MPTNFPKLNAQRVLLRSQLTRVVNNPCVLFCVITLLLTVIVMLCFPTLGGIIAQHHQF
jgi:hypothetical protein